MMGRLVVSTLLLVTSFSPNASERARDLVAATKLVSQLHASKEQCTRRESTIDVERIAASNPALFRGVIPGAERWPEVRAAYLRYAVQSCVPDDIEGYAKAASEVYATRLSDDEITVALKFFDSDLGRKFVAASTALSAQIGAQMQDESDDSIRRGSIKFNEELDVIISTMKSPSTE